MKRLSYFILLTLLMSLTSSPTLATPDFSAVNQGTTIYYKIVSEDDKTVEVTFNGSSPFSPTTKYTGDVVIPSSVTNPNNETPYTVTRIGNLAFGSCTGLNSVTLPNSVRTIVAYAFTYCSGLTTIIIPNNSVTSIEEDAFQGCTSLTSITIPNSATSIHKNAFRGCTGLASISVDPDNTIYDSRGNCNAIIETLTNKLFIGCKNTVIPNTVTEIGESAFSWCILTTISIPNSVTKIGTMAFYHAASLTSITIPSSVTIIKNDAFDGCTGLTSVTICGVPTIEDYTFFGCSALTSVYFLGATPTIGDYNAPLTNQAKVYVPLQYLDGYRSSASGPITDANLYPLLLPGTAYRTLSFDKAVDLSSIAGVNNSGNTLKAFYVKEVDVENGKVILDDLTGEVAAGEGIIIKGAGAEGECYPIRPAAGSPSALATNYMKGSGAATKAIDGPSDGKQRYFIMDGNGDFYYCTGGILPAYKAYLDLGELIPVGGSSAKSFSIVFEDEESTGINGIAETKGAQAEAWYTIGGQRLQGKPSTKGLYIVNGKKVIVK